MALVADAPALVRPGVLLRALPRETTASHAGIATATLLGVGLLISIVTTPDPLWWHLHFSRLGTFAAFSGYVFNATIVATSAGVVVFALRLRHEMVRHAGTPVLTSRRGAVVVPSLVALLGIHLSFVGFFPVNANEFVHDRGSTGAVLMFIVILASSRWTLRGMHRVMSRTTRWVSLGLAATVAAYIGEFINLAAFELIVFSLVFSWLLLFARTVGRPADEPARPVASRTGSMHSTVIVAARDRAEHVATAARGALPAQTRMREATRPRGPLHTQRRVIRSQTARRPDPEHPRARRLHTIRA